MRHNYNPLANHRQRRITSLISRIFKYLEHNKRFNLKDYDFANIKEWNQFKTKLIEISEDNYTEFMFLLLMYFTTLHEDFNQDYKAAVYEMSSSLDSQK